MPFFGGSDRYWRWRQVRREATDRQALLRDYKNEPRVSLVIISDIEGYRDVAVKKVMARRLASAEIIDEGSPIDEYFAQELGKEFHATQILLGPLPEHYRRISPRRRVDEAGGLLVTFLPSEHVIAKIEEAKRMVKRRDEGLLIIDKRDERIPKIIRLRGRPPDKLQT